MNNACFRWIVSTAAVLIAARVFGADIDREEQRAAFMQAAAKELPAEQQRTLEHIKEETQRHLAMTYYLRAGAGIEARWSWTQAQIDAYQDGEEYKHAKAEIERIASRFAAENPGYRLFVNTQVRSLEEQLRRWQEVRSIEVAAGDLRRAANAELQKPAYEATPSQKSLSSYLKFLIGWRAPKPPTLAAPGLSLHGRGRAYDFQIRKENGKTVAGTDSSTIQTVWDAQGWTGKLAKAVHGASDRFTGPLEAPREPWHYQYRPRE